MSSVIREGRTICLAEVVRKLKLALDNMDGLRGTQDLIVKNILDDTIDYVESSFPIVRYQVALIIDVDAKSAYEAAQKARQDLVQATPFPSRFHVRWDHAGPNETVIDLGRDEYDQSGEPDR